MIAAIIVSSLFFLLIAPLLLKVYAFYFNDKKTAYISVKLFFIPIIRGKVFYENGLYLQINKKIKPVSAYFKKIKKGAKPLYDFNIIKVKNAIKIGAKNDTFMRVITGFYLGFLEKFLTHIVKIKKPFIKTDNEIEMFEEEHFFNIYFSITAVFNLYVVIANFIKMMIGRK